MHDILGKIHANFGTISTDNQLIINYKLAVK